MLSPISRSLLTASSLMLGSILLAPSCADNKQLAVHCGRPRHRIFRRVCQPDITGPFRSGGTLDTAFASGYTAFLLVGNQLTQQGSREQLRTETSRVALRGAEVQLTTLDGQALTNIPRGARDVLDGSGTGFVDPAAGTTPSYSAVAVNLIPPGLTACPRKFLAKIRVFGDTLGGTSITSSELDFAINVCNGCLINYDTPDVTQPAGAILPLCATTTASSTQNHRRPSVPTRQDQSFSCTLCSATEICREPVQNPTFATRCTP